MPTGKSPRIGRLTGDHLMTPVQAGQTARKLMQWFEAQGIAPENSILAMTIATSAVLHMLTDGDQDDIDDGVRRLGEVMRCAAALKLDEAKD